MADGQFPPTPVVATPRDLPAHTPIRIVRPRGRGEKVMAILAKTDGDVRTENGEIVRYRAGEHYVVDYASGSRQVVRRDIFERTYRKTRPGVFRKKTDIRYRAAVAQDELQVATLEGVRPAHAGDWIMIGVADEMWPVPAADAKKKYKGVPAVGWTGVGTTVFLVFLLLAFVAWIAT